MSADDELLKEFIFPQSGMLFKEEIIGPIFCKPKLIPLKSVTLEKLEKMQQEGLEKMKQMEVGDDMILWEKTLNQISRLSESPSKTSKPKRQQMQRWRRRSRVKAVMYKKLIFGLLKKQHKISINYAKPNKNNVVKFCYRNDFFIFLFFQLILI